MDTLLMPVSEYGDRVRVGGWAQFGTTNPLTIIPANDPRMSLTYAEFPLHSFDQLLDCALSHSSQSSLSETPCLLDLGSGYARLVLYAALSRPGYMVYGIEISDLLHEKATEALQRGMDHGYFLTDDSTTTTSTTNIQLHCGPASDTALAHVWEEAQVVFCYSTVWPAPNFSIPLQAMVLGPEWSHLLATVCQPGCIVITTDRVLNPLDGWLLLDRMDVDNPQLLGSTGYIQRLIK
jgi:SAM-dependent methyltransferase